MAKLTNFLYCLDVERCGGHDGSGEYINAKNVISLISPEYVPGAFSFSLVFTILDIEPEGVLKIAIKNTEKEIFSTDPINLPAITNFNTQIPNEYIGYNLSIDIRNLLFEEEGAYCTEIYYNDSLIDSKPIYVKGKRYFTNA